MHGTRHGAPVQGLDVHPGGATVGHIDRARDLLHRIDAGTAGPEHVHAGHMAEQVGRPLLALRVATHDEVPRDAQRALGPDARGSKGCHAEILVDHRWLADAAVDHALLTVEERGHHRHRRWCKRDRGGMHHVPLDDATVL